MNQVTQCSNYISEVRQFIINNFLLGDGSSLRDDDSFLETNVVDSTGMLELVVFLEGTYGIKLEQEEMIPENLDSVARVAEFLERKTAKRQG